MSGFPQQINTDEVKRVYETCSDLDLQPMTVMSALLRTDDEVVLVMILSVVCLISWPVVFDLHNKAQLSLTNPHDAKTCQKLLQFDVKTSCRQVNDLFEVMEFGCFEVSEFGHYTACYQQYWPCAQFVGPISHVRVLCLPPLSCQIAVKSQCIVAMYGCIPEMYGKIKTPHSGFHRSWCQLKMHMRLSISH